MTDRISSLTVVLEQNIRDDDAEPLIAAIKQIRGVLTVTPRVADPADYTAEVRAKSELGKKLLEVLYPDMYKKGPL